MNGLEEVFRKLPRFTGRMHLKFQEYEVSLKWYTIISFRIIRMAIRFSLVSYRVIQSGFTTQNPSCYEVCSNEATTKQRKRIVDGNTIIVYRPVTNITEKNKSVLQFLDLMSVIDKYSEITGAELSTRLKLIRGSV